MKEARERLTAALPQWGIAWEGARRLWRVTHPVCPWLVVEGERVEDVIDRAAAVAWALGVDIPVGPVTVH